jgi:hypothetical protein
MLSSVSVDSTDGSCWVADAGLEKFEEYRPAIEHRSASGALLSRTTGFLGPASLSVNPMDGSCWVADTLNGQVAHLVICCRFDDVPCEHWARDAINACVIAGIVSGYPDGTYHPTEPVTRAQMAVYVSRALAGGDAHVPTGPATPSFTDVATTDWAYKYIEYAKAQTVVAGYPDGSYGPGITLDRGQMAVFIARAIATPTDRPDLPSYTPPLTPSFPDVTADNDWAWAYKYVEYIKQKGVTSGYPDGQYHPEYICTRDQMAVYVARAFGLPT